MEKNQSHHRVGAAPGKGKKGRQTPEIEQEVSQQNVTTLGSSSGHPAVETGNSRDDSTKKRRFPRVNHFKA
jgi:hypothetical protein